MVDGKLMILVSLKFAQLLFQSNNNMKYKIDTGIDVKIF